MQAKQNCLVVKKKSKELVASQKEYELVEKKNKLFYEKKIPGHPLQIVTCENWAREEKIHFCYNRHLIFVNLLKSFFFLLLKVFEMLLLYSNEYFPLKLNQFCNVSSFFGFCVRKGKKLRKNNDASTPRGKYLFSQGHLLCSVELFSRNSVDLTVFSYRLELNFGRKIDQKKKVLSEWPWNFREHREDKRSLSFVDGKSVVRLRGL